MKLIFVFVYVVNMGFSDIGYRIGHILLGAIIGVYRYGSNISVCYFLFFYLLALELVAETIIFPKKRRRMYHAEGKEILADLRAEIKKTDNI